jgi:sulfate transport system substrate-binding protein
MWNILAVYGAGLRGAGGSGDAAAAAIELLAAVLRNVDIMDRSARDSMLTFERGVGDAVITYENEIFAGRAKGQRYDYVVPRSTLLIENPVAVVDGYAERHGAGELARAFVAFLWTPEAQRLFARHGLRPVVPAVAAEVQDGFPAVADLFTIRDLGGWADVERVVFAPGGVYDQALARSRGARP